MCDENSLFLSVITFGELQNGIHKLAGNHRAARLQSWVDEELKKRFYSGILTLHFEVMSTWGRILGLSEKNRIKLPLMDSLIATTAVAHDLIVVTRNVQDFERCQVSIHNPWIE